jgi:hypothetical protein
MTDPVEFRFSKKDSIFHNGGVTLDILYDSDISRYLYDVLWRGRADPDSSLKNDVEVGRPWFLKNARYGQKEIYEFIECYQSPAVLLGSHNWSPWWERGHCGHADALGDHRRYVGGSHLSEEGQYRATTKHWYDIGECGLISHTFLSWREAHEWLMCDESCKEPSPFSILSLP